MLFSSKKCLFPYLNIFFKQSPERLRDVLTIEFDSQERLNIIFQNKVYFLGLSLKLIFWNVHSLYTFCTVNYSRTVSTKSWHKHNNFKHITSILSLIISLLVHLETYLCGKICEHSPRPEDKGRNQSRKSM